MTVVLLQSSVLRYFHSQADHIKAKMEDGILHVTFPRNQPDQAPTRIAIA